MDFIKGQRYQLSIKNTKLWPNRRIQKPTDPVSIPGFIYSNQFMNVSFTTVIGSYLNNNVGQAFHHFRQNEAYVTFVAAMWRFHLDQIFAHD